MSWTWNTASPNARAWMLRHIGQQGRTWTPPPPLPANRSSPRPFALRQRAGILLVRWPVRPPAGHQPLPAEARALKALDTETVCALYEEAGRLRLPACSPSFQRPSPRFPQASPDGSRFGSCTSPATPGATPTCGARTIRPNAPQRHAATFPRPPSTVLQREQTTRARTTDGDSQPGRAPLTRRMPLLESGP